MSNSWQRYYEVSFFSYFLHNFFRFHAIYWPAFLLGAELPLPKRLFIHGHWLVDNVKVSKAFIFININYSDVEKLGKCSRAI